MKTVSRGGAESQREDIQPWLDDPWGVQTGAPTRTAEATGLRKEEAGAELWISGAALQLVPAFTTAHSRIRMAAAELWQPLAEHVGLLGWRDYRSGRAVAAAELAPNYLRASAAEEKRRQIDVVSDTQSGT